jgi:arsenite methyltransferase
MLRARRPVRFASCWRAGFTDVDIEPTRVYQAADARTFLESAGLNYDSVAGQVEGAFISAFVRATKPAVGP